MRRQLSTSIAYSSKVIEPFIDSTRDEGEKRLVALRAVLRLFSRSVDSSTLMDRESSSSLGALMAAKRGAELGIEVLDCIMNPRAETKARACLVCSSYRVLSVEDADELDEEERIKCIPILGEERVALPSQSTSTSAHVVVTVAKSQCGGNRDAKVDIERTGDETVRLTVVSSSGARKTMASGAIPPAAINRLFDIAAVLQSSSSVSMRKNELPEYIKLHLVDFLERRLRLQVLCTAAVHAPNSRPVLLDRAYLREFDESHKNWLRIAATLHPASSSCLCGAHGLRFEWSGSVSVNLETCGRRLQQTADGSLCCPCHENATDERGNARFSLDGYCTEGTFVSVTCFHRRNRFAKKGVAVNMKLTDADRMELSAMLLAMSEFEGRTAKMFNKNWATDQPEVDRYISILSSGLKERITLSQMKQLEEEDPETTNTRSMLQRDMTTVDLLRGGGVFLHHVKKGRNRGAPYLRRAKRNEDSKPLTDYESDLVCTHGHLFRKAI